MLNIYGETLSEVEIDTLDETLVESQGGIQVGSLENTLTKKEISALFATLVARVLLV